MTDSSSRRQTLEKFLPQDHGANRHTPLLVIPCRNGSSAACKRHGLTRLHIHAQTLVNTSTCVQRAPRESYANAMPDADHKTARLGGLLSRCSLSRSSQKAQTGKPRLPLSFDHQSQPVIEHAVHIWTADRGETCGHPVEPKDLIPSGQGNPFRQIEGSIQSAFAE